MTIKEKVASILEQNCGEFVSGQELARQLGCTRGAVWKAIKELIKQGFEITAVTNKGYCLETSGDILTLGGVKKYLSDRYRELDIRVFDCVDSTNEIIKEYAKNGESEGKVVIARQQTGGKGRLGRSFFSPKDSGLYLSILLRPQMPMSKAMRITTCAALAVCDAIESATGSKPGIKWVNDVYLNGAKVCGILTEAAVSVENGGFDYAVLGIGVNVYVPQGGFPKEIADVAGAVANDTVPRLKNKLAGRIISSFMDYYHDVEKGGFRRAYSERLMWKGEDIYIIGPQGRTPCRIIDVDDECRLEVEMENGEKRLISSGEISIRRR